MNTKAKLILAIVIMAALSIALTAGGWFAYTAYASGVYQSVSGFNGGCHNNQAVLNLLKVSESELKAQRQAGKSLLDIATAKGVSEQALTDALMQPMTTMHNWMAQGYPQSNTGQMTQYMRDWISKDIREPRFGTMTDARLFSGSGGGMMNGLSGPNGFGGMMSGSYGTSGFGGMMRGGGMMGGWTP